MSRSPFLRPLVYSLLLTGLTSLALALIAPSGAIACPHPLTGGSQPEPPPDEPPDDPDCENEGDPVSPYSGKWYHEETDLTVPGVMPIEMVRRYDSQSVYDSPLGHGWAFTYDIRLFEYPDQSVVLRDGSHRRLRFIYMAGAYQTPPEITATLTKDLGNGTHSLRFPAGNRLDFDSLGRLVAIESPQGNRLELSYDPNPATIDSKWPLTGTSKHAINPGIPTTVAHVYHLDKIAERLASGDLTGRFVEFHYDPVSGRLTSINSHDNRSVTYAHEVDSASGKTTGNLETVTGLENVVSAYTYEDEADPHNITSFEIGGVRPITNFYENDRVKTQYLGDPPTHTTLEFNYTIDPFPKTVVERTVRDAEGNTLHGGSVTTTYQFDSDGYPTEIIDALGNKTVYVRDSTTKRLGTRQIFQNLGTVAEPNLELLQEATFGYDGEGNLTSRTVDLGGALSEVVTETWTYDQHWTESYQVSSAEPSKLFRTEYIFYRAGPNPSDPPINIHEIKRRRADGSFATTALTYDANGQLEAITPPAVDPADGLEIRRVYYTAADDEPGLVLNGLLHRVELWRDDGGTPTLDPHLRRSFTYDAQGRVDEVTDARGNETDFDFDALGRLVKTTNARGEETHLTYAGPNQDTNYATETPPPGSHLETVETGRTATEGEGRVQRLRWDGRGRLVKVERKDDSGQYADFASFSYDSDGNRLSATDAEGRTARFAYDLLSRLASVTDAAVSPNTTEFAYDAAGNRTRVTDALARDTALVYDALDRLVEVRQEGISPELVTQFAYDAADNVTKVTDPKGQETAYAYDPLSRLTAVTQELGQTVNYAYDARDRLETVTNARGHVLRYTYLPWGGLEQVFHDLDGDGAEPGERTIAYGYDLSGNVTAVSDSDLDPDPSTPTVIEPLYTFLYDELDRVDTATASYLPGAPVLDSGYDRFGDRDALQLTDGGPGSPLAHGWAFDAFGRLDIATLPGSPSPLVFDYLANDDLRQITHSNGLVTDLAYHPEGPIQSIKVGSTPLLEFVYTLDPVLNVDTIAETIDGTLQSPVYGYGYDEVYRLTSAVYPTGLGLPTSESFPYDAAGNRDDDPQTPTPWSYDANNRIEASPATPVWCHDADGNLATKRSGGDCDTGLVTETFTFDATNHLRTWSDGTATASYTYDPFGRRIRKTVGGTPTWYLWDGDQLLAEYDSSGSRTARYAYAGGFAPLQYATPNGSGGEDVYEVHSDHLDTPKLLTDASGNSVWRAAHEAFGKAALDPASTVTFNVRFPGQYADVETGLAYNRYRYYDPLTGRYVSADPIGQADHTNLFQYARNNPIRYTDPQGLAPVFPLPGGACPTPTQPDPPPDPPPDRCKRWANCFTRFCRAMFLICQLTGSDPEPEPEPIRPPPIEQPGPRPPGPPGPKPPGPEPKPPGPKPPPGNPPEPPPSGEPGPGGGKPPWKGL